MATANPNERLMRFLSATAEQQMAIDRILAGEVPASQPAATGPLLLAMGEAAKFLGVSRSSLWRMMRAGKLKAVEVLPGFYKLRRADLEAVAKGGKRS